MWFWTVNAQMKYTSAQKTVRKQNGNRARRLGLEFRSDWHLGGSWSYRCEGLKIQQFLGLNLPGKVNGH